MNIEEAREAIEAVLRRLTGTQAEVMEAADAYAQAVLDEAEECVVPPSAGWDDEALRDRIGPQR